MILVTSQDLKQLSKFMSLVLRHEPERIGIALDEHGWADLEEFAAALAARFAGAGLEDIRQVVRTDGKGRYVIAEGRIRASQGHSIDVDTVGAALAPPPVLYHGTTAQAWEAIRATGAIVSMSRKHVHLSTDVATASTVAQRRKGPHVILQIDSARMHREACAFYRSENGVWLTETVEVQYVSPLPGVGKR